MATKFNPKDTQLLQDILSIVGGSKMLASSIDFSSKSLDQLIKGSYAIAIINSVEINTGKIISSGEMLNQNQLASTLQFLLTEINKAKELLVELAQE